MAFREVGMDPLYVLEHSKLTIDLLDRERESFLCNLNSAGEGKLGFSMIAVAMAAFDSYAWLLFQTFDLKKSNHRLFSELLNDGRFFDRRKYMDVDTLYSRIRCGVIHQLFPKNALIGARQNSTILYRHNGMLLVNSYALLCDVLGGIHKIHTYIENLSVSEKADLSLKLVVRAKIDAQDPMAPEHMTVLPDWH
jgi:hypothetical protein